MGRQFWTVPVGLVCNVSVLTRGSLRRLGSRGAEGTGIMEAEPGSLADRQPSMCAEPCPAVLSPMDCSPPGFSVLGISQARVLEWVTISFSRGSSQWRTLKIYFQLINQLFATLGLCHCAWAALVAASRTCCGAHLAEEHELWAQQMCCPGLAALQQSLQHTRGSV